MLLEKLLMARATPTLLLDDSDREALCEKDSIYFHYIAAKALYLGLHTRTEVLLTAAVLVIMSLLQLNKLRRLQKYLNKFPNIPFHINNNPIIVLKLVLMLHSDFRSHTGVVITVGTTPIWMKCKRQHINTVNSTESEIVALSDQKYSAILICDFLKAQGYDTPAPIIFQDNTSAIRITDTKVKICARKYLIVRQTSISDLVKTGKIIIKYLSTSKIGADGLTKP